MKELRVGDCAEMLALYALLEKMQIGSTLSCSCAKMLIVVLQKQKQTKYSTMGVVRQIF